MKQGLQGNRRSGKACVFALIIEREVGCSMRPIQQALLIDRTTRLLSSYTTNWFLSPTTRTHILFPTEPTLFLK